MTLDAAGKTVLVTGSTDGVGKLVAEQLARAGAHVLVHGRNPEKGARVVADVRRATGNDAVTYYNADFSSLDEVRRLGATIVEAHDRLDVLINNAGIGGGPQPRTRRETSRDGYELRFAVNYLAPFLLTHLLLPTLRRSVPARVVNVASAGQYPIDFDDVMLTRRYEGWHAYAQSKLAQVMFTITLAERLAGSGVTVNALHPATYMNTKIVIEGGNAPRSTVEEGAHAIVYVATSPELETVTGAYFDGTRRARANAQAYDETARDRLWRLSAQLTGIATEPAGAGVE